MTIRTLNDDDIKQLKKTYNKFYSKQFEFPDFSKFFGSYVVIDNDEIVTAGGVRPIAEAVLITNKSKSEFIRTKALLKMLEINKNLCKENDLDQLHAFVNGKTWIDRLTDVGFKSCKGNAIYIDV